MIPPPPQILVCTEGKRVCVRIRGRANVTISVAFKELLSGLLDRQVEHFEMELSECQTMDSTFLGILCGFARRHGELFAGSDDRPILFNANRRVKELLDSLGVEHMFVFRQGTQAKRGECVPHPTEHANQPSHETLNATSLEAHETLMALNPDNIPKFKDLAAFLAEDLKKLRDDK